MLELITVSPEQGAHKQRVCLVALERCCQDFSRYQPQGTAFPWDGFQKEVVFQKQRGAGPCKEMGGFGNTSSTPLGKRVARRWRSPTGIGKLSFENRMRACFIWRVVRYIPAAALQ